ncbi:MAG: hypothetical protein VX667_08100, partial [Nitrospinota bacterium]|nr:hypothetical protein [Nitrospinota bacterium]
INSLNKFFEEFFFAITGSPFLNFALNHCVDFAEDEFRVHIVHLGGFLHVFENLARTQHKSLWL